MELVISQESIVRAATIGSVRKSTANITVIKLEQHNEIGNPVISIWEFKVYPMFKIRFERRVKRTVVVKNYTLILKDLMALPYTETIEKKLGTVPTEIKNLALRGVMELYR